MRPSISVIIPIYCTEDYLARCLESVLGQTFQDFEVICVDDCTPDNSVAIVEEYQRRDPRIRLIRHERNLGLGGARNSGIRAAAADYIASVDSDDTMKPHMLEALWLALEGGAYDIVECGFDYVDIESSFVSARSVAPASFENNDRLDIFTTLMPAFWNKLWRRTLFIDNDIWFPENVFFQDSATTPRLVAKARTLRQIADSLYNYVQRPGSASASSSPKHLVDYFKLFDVIADFLVNEGLWNSHRARFIEFVDRNIKYHISRGVDTQGGEEASRQYIRHLLMFKTGYLACRTFLAEKTDDELVDILEKGHVRSGMLNAARMLGQVQEVAYNGALNVATKINKYVEEVLPKPKISVIIPVFQCEPFLEKCLDSVLNQTFQDFEIICVDDCTPDNSVVIIEEYQRRDPRIQLIRHERNLGLGGARNTGIRAAKADYIASVDSDDTMQPHMLETLWRASENGTYDVVSAGFERVDSDGNVISVQASPNKIISEDIDIFRSMNPAFWNKLWRKSLYLDNNIEFPNHLYYQDSATTPRILAKASKVRLLNDRVYNYLVRSGSVTQSTSPKHILDYFRVFDVLYDFLNSEGIYDRYKDDFFAYIDRCLNHHAAHGLSNGGADGNAERDIRHLILFKTGYIGGKRLLDGKNRQELLTTLESSRVRSDLFPDDSRPVLPLSLIVKTFLRPVMLERFLLSAGEYEAANAMRFREVVIGDDSPLADVEENRRVIRKVKDVFPTLNVHHHVFEEYIGLSAGRNRLVSLAREKHVLLCDDDFVLDEEADIKGALNLVESGDYDLVGGWLKNHYNFATGEYKYWGTYGTICETDDDLIINLNEKPIASNEIHPSDYLLNFFVASRDCLLSNPWDEALKVEEHQEFFYRFKKNRFKASLFGGLFVRHTADRADNPPKYNHFRFSKEVWEGYLYLALDKMGKKRRRFNRIRRDHFEHWAVDSVERKSTSGNVPWLEPMLGQLVPVTALTPSTEQCFGGYYDVRLVSEDGRYAICQTSPVIDRLPTAIDSATIMVIDLANDNAMRSIGSTSAWCHQQGAHAQFMYGKKGSVIFNVFDPELTAFASREVDIYTNQERAHPRPVSALSPNGKTAASLNFSRLYDYRPGYGYAHVPDPFAGAHAPSEDGLWTFDLETGEESLVISYAEARAFLQREGFHAEAEGKLIFNHVAFNTDGSKMFLLLRLFSPQAPHPTFTLVCNSDGTNLRRVFGFSSHYHWKDKDTILLTGSHHIAHRDIKKVSLFELNTEDGTSRAFSEEAFAWDGHCSYSPDGQFMLFDCYPNASFPYSRLIIYRFGDGKMVDLGHFFSPRKWFNGNTDLRCDLHPRWSPNGELITFDSIHGGYRGVYAIKTRDAVAALDASFAQLSRSELIRWFKAKYDSKAAAPAPAAPKVAAPKPAAPKPAVPMPAAPMPAAPMPAAPMPVTVKPAAPVVPKPSLGMDLVPDTGSATVPEEVKPASLGRPPIVSAGEERSERSAAELVDEWAIQRGPGSPIARSSRHGRKNRVLGWFGRRNRTAETGDFIAAGDWYRDSMQYRSAATCYSAALKLTPTAMPIWVQLGHMHKETGEYSAALEAYMQARNLNPRDADLNLQLGHYHRVTGNMAEALHFYRAAKELDPNDAEISRHVSEMAQFTEQDIV